MFNGSKSERFPLAERLKEARLARGYSQAELAELMLISKQAISQYETGANFPKPEVFEKLKEVLNFSHEYFLKEIPYKLTTPIFFRKMKTAKKREWEMFEVYVGYMVEIYQYLKKFINFPKPNFIRYEKERYSFEEIQQIAVEVRKSWGLGLGPISNLTILLENNGFLISKIKMGRQKVDACSVFKTNDGDFQPIIFLTPDTSSVRSRLDAAHELGHFVLHSWVDKDYFLANKDRIEDEAQWFAGAFLLPFEAIKRESYSLTSLDALLLLKQRWKVSAQAILFRCLQLDLINKNQYTYMQSKLSARGWRTFEPLDDEIEQEEPSMFKSAIQMILDNKIQTPTQIIECIALNKEEIDNLCGLDHSTLKEEKKVPVLKVIK